MDKPKSVGFQFVEDADLELAPPTKASPGASGFDLRADLLRNNGRIAILPDNWNLVPTGLRFEIPDGMEGQVRPRSGLALKHGVTVLNAPGTIDSDYKGELKVILINHGKQEYVVRHGDRIAQLVFMHLPTTQCVLVEHLTESERGEKGFGSSGLN